MPSRPSHFEIPVDDPDRAEWFATCRDTEGNKFGLFTNDPNASM